MIMNESDNNREVRKIRGRNKELLIIAVLLLLCIASAAFILSHYGKSGDKKAEKPAAETPAAEEAADETATEGQREKMSLLLLLMTGLLKPAPSLLKLTS